MDKSKRIAVIGAGASGLCVAKYLTAVGLDGTIFEIGTQIGGLWKFENDNGRSSAYSTLHINTSRGVTHFHDLDFDPDVQAFPDHRDMHRYLIKYAEHFDLVRRIRFKTRVIDIRPLFDPAKGEPSKWRMTFEAGGSEDFDAVIAATGHLTKPLHVPMFQNDFKGEYVHGHDYHSPERFVGKRVCVVGVGNSACDMATDICSTVQSCVLVARSGVMVLPKLFCGIPFTDITRAIQRPWLAGWIRRRLTRWLVYLVHGPMDRLGFKPLDKRAHVTSNARVVTDIAYRRIRVKHGIARIEGRKIHFVDGSSDDFDVLLAATGYLIDLPFLKPDILPIKDNGLDLYQRISPPDWPGLYMMGFFNTDTALNMVYEYQARWIRDLELGQAKLPPASEMQAAIKAKNDWLASTYKDSPRHTIEEEHVPYIRDLKRSLKKMRQAASA